MANGKVTSSWQQTVGRLPQLVVNEHYFWGASFLLLSRTFLTHFLFSPLAGRVLSPVLTPGLNIGAVGPCQPLHYIPMRSLSLCWHDFNQQQSIIYVAISLQSFKGCCAPEINMNVKESFEREQWVSGWFPVFIRGSFVLRTIGHRVVRTHYYKDLSSLKSMKSFSKIYCLFHNLSWCVRERTIWMKTEEVPVRPMPLNRIWLFLEINRNTIGFNRNTFPRP